MLRDAAVVAGKDLRLEARARVSLNQVTPFALLVLVVFAFALDPDRGVLRRTAPGLFWVTVTFSALLAVQRAFAVEGGDASDILRMAGLDPAAVFLGKATGIAAQLALLEVVLVAGVAALYDVPPHSAVLLGCTALLATVGLAAAGTIYGQLAGRLTVRDTLLPLLVLPVVAPVVLAATRAWEAGLTGSPGDGWPWARLLAVFAVAYVAFGVVAFGPLMEDV